MIKLNKNEGRKKNFENKMLGVVLMKSLIEKKWMGQLENHIDKKSAEIF